MTMDAHPSEFRLLLAGPAAAITTPPLVSDIAENAALLALVEPDIAGCVNTLIAAALIQVEKRRIANDPEVRAAERWIAWARREARVAAERPLRRSHVESRGRQR